MSSIDPGMFHSFAKEAGAGTRAVAWMGRNSARVGKGAVDVTEDTAKILRDSSHPKYLLHGLRSAFESMAPSSASKREELAERILKGNKRLRELGVGGKYIHHDGPGVLGVARRWGVLRNAPKYVGDSRRRKATNMLARALPGEIGTIVPLTAVGAVSDFHDTDGGNGRRRGLGERLGRAGLGATTGLVGMRGGLISGTVSNLAGTALGGALGRGVDDGAAYFRHTLGY